MKIPSARSQRLVEGPVPILRLPLNLLKKRFVLFSMLCP